MPRPIDPALDSIFYTFYQPPKEAREGEEGVHGPYRIQQSGDGYSVVNDLGETKGTHDTYDEARDQQKALYVNVPEAQEQAKEDEKSKSSRRKVAEDEEDDEEPESDPDDGFGGKKAPPFEKKQGSRRKIAEDENSSSTGTGPSFSSPDSMRGNWKCNDCGADDLGVHDLNGHADAHRQTSHRGSIFW